MGGSGGHRGTAVAVVPLGRIADAPGARPAAGVRLLDAIPVRRPGIDLHESEQGMRSRR
jgi:hypothetical protein